MASIFAGLQSQSIELFIADSSSTTGAGLAGLVWNTASLTAYYSKGATGSSTAISLATQTVGGAWTSGGFVERDATNMRGMYRLDLPNAMVDTEVMVSLHLRGAANMAPVPTRIDCRPLPSDLKKWLTVAPLALTNQRVETLVGAMAANVLTAEALAASAANEIMAAILDERADAVRVIGSYGELLTEIFAKLPAALVGGRMDSSVGAMANNVVTATALAENGLSAISQTIASAWINEADGWDNAWSWADAFLVSSGGLASAAALTKVPKAAAALTDGEVRWTVEGGQAANVTIGPHI